MECISRRRLLGNPHAVGGATADQAGENDVSFRVFLSKGRYRITYSGGQMYASAANGSTGCSFGIGDGTSIVGSASTSSVSEPGWLGGAIVAYVDYPSGAERTFSLKGFRMYGNSNCVVRFDTVAPGSLANFAVERLGQ